MREPNPGAAPRLWTIVLAAGEGKRLRRLTRALHGEDLPKQFAVLQGECSLLQTTVARTSRFSLPEHTVVVVAEEWEALARAQLAGTGVQLVVQPKNRGTGPGLLLPLTFVLSRDPDAVVVVTPADHYVRDVDPLLETVKSAEALARRDGSIVLVGAVPERAETQYGWIVRAPHSDRVARFQEKPLPAVAEELFRTGALWNTFMMVGPAARFWDLGREHLPTQARLLDAYRRAAKGAPAPELLADAYRRMQQADFSSDVLEHADRLRLVELSPCGWSDWGTPTRVMQSLRGSEDHRVLLKRLKARARRPSSETPRSTRPAHPRAA